MLIQYVLFTTELVRYYDKRAATAAIRSDTPPKSCKCFAESSVLSHTLNFSKGLCTVRLMHAQKPCQKDDEHVVDHFFK